MAVSGNFDNPVPFSESIPARRAGGHAFNDPKSERIAANVNGVGFPMSTTHNDDRPKQQLPTVLLRGWNIYIQIIYVIHVFSQFVSELTVEEIVELHLLLVSGSAPCPQSDSSPTTDSSSLSS
jgi:hypothetical protein